MVVHNDAKAIVMAVFRSPRVAISLLCIKHGVISTEIDGNSYGVLGVWGYLLAHVAMPSRYATLLRRIALFGSFPIAP
jgi:hypothetical protein